MFWCRSYPKWFERPICSKKSSLGIVNVILNSGLDISLKALTEKALDALQGCGVLKRDRETVLAEVLEFFKQREMNIFTEMKYSKDIVTAVLNTNSDNAVEALENKNFRNFC